MLLSQAEENKNFIIIRIDEGMQIRKKLAAMGIREGICLKVIKNDFTSPIMIGIKGSRISLGRGLGKKIEIYEDSSCRQS